MGQLFEKSLFIFRRDLRLTDNSALINALARSEHVLPCFIFDPRLLQQPKPHHNAIQFLIEALQDLDKKLRRQKSQLHFFYGIPEQILPELISKLNIGGIFFNRDYTPFSRQRDQHIQQICQKAKIECCQFGDSLLNEPEMVLKSNNEPYKVFTPYFHKATIFPITPPKQNPYSNYMKSKLAHFSKAEEISQKIHWQTNESIPFEGTKAACSDILSNLKKFQTYETTRDIPGQQGTTHLSAYLKFGICSIREAYTAISKKLGSNHPLIRQLYWRDFYTHIAFHFPHVFQQAFKPQYDTIEWSYDNSLFKAWCQGKTGFPIIDAGMRELNTSGWMHNRVRMIVASFLTKDLHIDWRWGERYFANKLIDYDPAVNNGNWQWAASTGVDAQPYFRIFNPWRQQVKYDSDCVYIKRWIPELTNIEPKIIHQWFKPTNWDSQTRYPKPIVNHKEESQYSKEIFRSASSEFRN